MPIKAQTAGRAITCVANLRQNILLLGGDGKMVPRFILFLITESMAGSNVNAPSTAKKTAQSPPIPTDIKIFIGKRSKALRLQNTARPLKKTALPAVDMVIAMALQSSS